jgi:pimeloyl-ACP methyl ester carboxylesterase
MAGTQGSPTLARRTLDVAGTRWPYLASSEAGPPLLVLTGALGEADFGSDLLQRLGRGARVIAPDYPHVRDLDEMIAGLAAILDAEGIERAHLLGGSFGGLIAQAFAAQRPERVRSLILSHTGAATLPGGRGAAVALLGLLPERLLRALFRRRLRPAVAIAGPEAVSRFDRAVAGLGKEVLLGRVRLALEIGRRHGGTGAAAFAGPVLILQGDDDPLIRPPDRSALAARFVQAESHSFAGTGHLAALLRPGDFAAKVTEFIARVEGRASPGQPSG